MTESRVVLEGRELHRVYKEDDGGELNILDGVEIAVSTGEVVAIVGASGSGKSTLLQILGCLDHPSAGTVLLDGSDVAALNTRELAARRNQRIGFVFQFHHLLREFTALENVMLPLLIGGTSTREARSRAELLLEQVGLSSRATHRPSELSGGEQQRVAVARALANRPVVVLADEPSGNLDTHTAEQLHDLFFQLRDEHGVAMVVATHNHELADRADRVLQLREGHLSTVPAV